jgi:hypothetical protein
VKRNPSKGLQPLGVKKPTVEQIDAFNLGVEEARKWIEMASLGTFDYAPYLSHIKRSTEFSECFARVSGSAAVLSSLLEEIKVKRSLAQ